MLGDVSRETMERLEIYADLVRKWTSKINLISRSSADDLWQRHILDSLQVTRCLTQPTGHWVDLGSGGGFPGVVVAIVAASEWPELRVTLVESDQRKCAFLRTALRETGVGGKVIAGRIESVPPQEADVLSARALSDLSALLGFAERHLKPTGIALFPKGVTWEKELSDAWSDWRFRHESITSSTNPRPSF